MKRSTILLASLLLTLVPAGAVPTASASSHSEVAILDAYFRPHDAGLGLPHCSRTPTNNVLLGEHFAWHLSGTPPTSFLVFHHDLIHTYESWRAANGHPALVSWNPATAIPASFAVDPACPARSSNSPGMSLPSWATVAGGATADIVFGYRSLCEFHNPDELSLSLEGWHNDVHGVVNGDMGTPDFAPRDPVFWAWHRFIDDIFHVWENNCTYSPSDPNDPVWRRCYGVYDTGYVDHDHSRYGPTDYPPGPLYGRCRDTLYGYGSGPCEYVRPCPYTPLDDYLGGGRDRVEPYVECAYGTGAYYGAPVRYVEPWLRGPVYDAPGCRLVGDTPGPVLTCDPTTQYHTYLPPATGSLVSSGDGNVGDCPKPNAIEAGLGLCLEETRGTPLCEPVNTGIEQPLYDYDGDLDHGYGGVHLFYGASVTDCFGWPSVGHHAGAIYALDALGNGPQFTVNSDYSRPGLEEDPDCGDNYLEPCDPNPPMPSTQPFPVNVVIDAVNGAAYSVLGPGGEGCNSLDNVARADAVVGGPSHWSPAFGPGADGALVVFIEQDTNTPVTATTGRVWTN